jgi:hypothetical protein
MGIVSARSADAQFVLSPGQSRNATFGVVRYNAVPPIGEGWNYDVVIEEIEIQPGQVVRSVRQNSLSFAHLTPGTFSGSSAAAVAPGAADAPADPNAVAAKMIELFDRKSRKK